MAATSATNSDSPAPTPLQRMRLYGPSLVTLAVLLPFFAYYLREVKTAQGYLNDRAFRILDVMSRQFGSEIIGVGNTMDAASILPEQFSLRQRDNVLSPRAKWLAERKAPFKDMVQAEMKAYLDAYILDGISTSTVDVAEKASPKPKADSEAIPQISVCCRSANSALQLRLFDDRVVNVPEHGRLHITIETKLDPDQMTERALGAGQGSLFETVFVASRTGRVLAERNSSKLNVRDVQAILSNRRVRMVIEGGQKPEKEDTSPESADQPGLPRQVWGSDQRFDVEVSGTSYVLFVAPAPFVLGDESGNEMPIAFYGLTAKSAIDAQARRLPSLIVPVSIILVIAGMAFLWPVLKLYTMSDRDRVTKSSVFAMLGAALVAGALLGALYLSYGFFLDMSERNDRQVVQLSDQIRAHFLREIGDAVRVSESILETLEPGNQWPPDGYFLLTRCCQTNFERYPFLGHVILLGPKPKGETALATRDFEEPVDQRQIIKYSATQIPTPLISLPTTRFGFIGRLVDGQYATLGASQFVLESFVSPNTGEFLPTLAFNPPIAAYSGFRFLATTQFPSLVHVLLPQGFGFAVVDPDGQVLFHSDPSRNLHENFFGETDPADELKAALRRREQKLLWLRYGGREVRAYVRPLGCEEAEENCIHDFDMGLIVFLGMDDQKDLLSSVSANFLAYLLALPLLVSAVILIGAGVKSSVWPAATITSARRRIWPRSEEKPFYLLKAMWGLICFAAALLITVVFRLAAHLSGSLPLALPAVLGAVFIVCIIGIIALRRKPALVGRLAASNWIKRCENRIPLSAAYSARIFAVALAVAGIFSIIVFQLAVSTAQVRVNFYHDRALAAAIHNRRIRYLADFNKYFENPGRADVSWSQFCQDRVNGGYDLYDGLAIEQVNMATLARLTTILRRFGFLDSSREITLPPDPCKPAVTAPAQGKPELEQESIWSAVPRPSLTYLGLFYVPGLLMVIAVFLWMHRIVRRLFILDFREPSPLPFLDEAACIARMQEAIDGPVDRPLDRILIFAHPRSGTGVALERIAKHLKEGSPAIADLNIVDCGKTGGAEHTNPKIAILDNFEVRLTDTKERVKRLESLEKIVYSHKPSVYVFTSVDPLLLLESLVQGGSKSEELQSELNRWTRVLGNFERCVFEDTSLDTAFDETVESIRAHCRGIRLADSATQEYGDTFQAELKPTLFLRACAPQIDLNKLDFTSGRHFEDSLVRLVNNLAEGYYRVIWLYCTNDERLALYQLAKDNWLNPLNKVAISHLLKKQLLMGVGAYRDTDGTHRNTDGAYRLMGAYRLINVSFRKFVLEAVTPRELAMWEKQQNLSLWPALRMALMLSLFLVVLFVSYFWRDIFDVYLSYFVALAGGVAALVRIVAQFFIKDGTKLSVLTGGGGAKGGTELA
jgi:hypothetical protein